MELTKDGIERDRAIMLKNCCLANNSNRLSRSELSEILSTSFWNHLLRFVIIDDQQYPANARVHIRGDFFLAYTNRHQENIRMDYDRKKEVLFIETKELIPHPFLATQRIDHDAIVGVMLHGYKHCGFVDPNEKITKWNKTGKEISLDEISSLTIDPFWDRPKALWSSRSDYTAYRIFITTKKS